MSTESGSQTSIPSPPASTSGASKSRSGPRERKRSRLGCIVCKQRKVKCDERPGGCSNCERLDVSCPGYGAAPTESPDAVVEAIFAKAGRKRRRMLGSCRECRATKSRCSGEKPACDRCAKRGLECEYSESRQRQSSAHATSPTTARRKSNSSPTTPGDAAAAAAAARSSWVDTVLGGQENWTVPVPVSVPEMDVNMTETDEMEWLCRPTLPDNIDQLRILVDTYFSYVHPLRSFSFLHKPTFLRHLDEGLIERTYGNHLLLAICALAANVLVWISSPEEQCSRSWRSRDNSRTICVGLPAGELWAKKAQSIVMGDLNHMSVEKLMTMVLLCEYGVRTKQHGIAFLLSGLVVRSAQALLLDVDQDETSSTERMSPTELSTARESRRRLMWSIYSLDVHMSSGVRRLITVQPENITIPLPCQERNYLLQIPCSTEALVPSAPESERAPLKDNLGLEAYYIRLLYIRGTILQQIRVRNHHPASWKPDSMFQKLARELQNWEADLPQTLLLTSTNIYIRREQGQLGALFSLHLNLHQNYCDLYRITMPGYNFPATASFEGAPRDFWTECKETCHYHARSLSEILDLALKHGRTALADPMCTLFAFESVRHQLVYLVSCCEPSRRKQMWEETGKNLEIGLRTLLLCKGVSDTAADCISSIHEILGTLNLCGLLQPSKNYDLPDREGPRTQPPERMVPQDLNNLHPFAPYRLARESLVSPKSLPIRPGQPTISNVRTSPATGFGDSADSEGFQFSTSGSEGTTVDDCENLLARMDFRRIADENRDLLGWDPMLFGPPVIGDWAMVI